MNYFLHEIEYHGNPVKKPTDNIKCSSKRSADEYIETRISNEGLDWRSGYAFKTLAMDKPMAFFKRNNQFLKV